MASIMSCGGDPTGPERDPPAVRVTFPTMTAYDRDDDGLIDVEVRYSDSLSGVALNSIRLTNEPAVLGIGVADNLLDHWRVESIDSTGFVLEETRDALLPRGLNRLTVTVQDRAGNESLAEATVSMPPAVLHKTIDLHASMWRAVSNVLIPEGDSRVYTVIEEPSGSAVSIVDLESLEWVETVRTPTIGLSQASWDGVRNRIYVQSYLDPVLAVFDVGSASFLPSIPITSRSFDVVVSPLGDRAFVSLEVEGPSNGFVSVVDLALGSEVSVLDLGVANSLNPGLTLGMLLAVRQDGVKLFAITNPLASQGILVVDLLNGTLERQVPLRPGDQNIGGGRDIDYISGRLIATSITPNGSGSVVQFEGPNYEMTQVGITGHFLIPKELDVSPDGFEYAISLGDQGAGYNAVQLMNTTSLGVEWEYRFPSGASIPQGVAFGGDGRLFVVAGALQRQPEPVPAKLFIYLRR